MQSTVRSVTWSVSGYAPCTVCAAEATCGGAGGVETACNTMADTVCKVYRATRASRGLRRGTLRVQVAQPMTHARPASRPPALPDRTLCATAWLRRALEVHPSQPLAKPRVQRAPTDPPAQPASNSRALPRPIRYAKSRAQRGQHGITIWSFLHSKGWVVT